jgi:hypothetical protein
MKTHLLPALFCAASFVCVAQQKPEIVTDRPDQTEAPVLVPANALQVETGFIYESDKHDNMRSKKLTYNTTLLRYGVNQNFELRLLSEYLGEYVEVGETIAADVKGLSPLTVGLKIRLADEKGIWPQAALLGHINLKTGSSAFAPKYTAADFRFAFSHTLSERFALDYNAGAEWSGDGEEPRATFLSTASLFFAITSKLGSFVESYSFYPEKARPDHRCDVGIVYKFTPVVQWDVSAGLGLSEESPDNFISTGLSIRFFK